MKTILFSPTFQKKLKTITRMDKKLADKILKQLKLFQNNPRHPSLRLHKLTGNMKNTWSLSVNMHFRLIFIDDTEFYFFDMGMHDDIYE